MSESGPQPTEIRAPKGARRLEIDWADEERTAYAHVILRAFCPCAHCQGHQGPVAYVEGSESADLELRDLEAVGNYALRLTWGDGHGTGIYTYRFLRELAPFGESPVEAVRERVFHR